VRLVLGGGGFSPGPVGRGSRHRWNSEARPVAVVGDWPSLDCAAERAIEAAREPGSFTCRSEQGRVWGTDRPRATTTA
jgi:hypothetical protein